MMERFASALDGSSAALVVLEVSVLEDCEYIPIDRNMSVLLPPRRSIETGARGPAQNHP